MLESPWDDGDDIAPYSMRPFVEGLAELHESRLIYRTFTSGAELSRLLVDGEAIDSRSGRFVLYISSHGRGGRLAAGRLAERDINLGPLASRTHKGFEGVWLGACDVADGSIDEFLSGGGALWAGGYRCSVDWSASMIIDIAVLDRLLGLSRAPTTRSDTIRAFADAFERFDGQYQIGEDRHGAAVTLCDGIRLAARDKGGRPHDVTDDLRRRLGWSDAD